MIDFSETIIKDLIFHRFSYDDRKSFVNSNSYEYQNDEEEDILKKIFIKPFQSNIITYEFKHDIDLELNPLFKLSKNILQGDKFIDTSKDIFQHLKNVSKHPNIKDGDLFILKYDDVKLDNVFYEALGIYKIESQDNYIEPIQDKDGKSLLNFKKGIGAKKLDKACLILFTKRPYTILIIDNGGKETEYWRNEFINIVSKDDSINSTDQFLSLTRSFIENKLSQNSDISKIETIELLNKSLLFFKRQESFDIDKFADEVIGDPNMIKEFKDFKQDYQKENNINIKDNFNVASQAVKKQSGKFKSLIKLDKNFDIHIYGDSSLIKKGIDPDGKKYYKIYYKEEN